MEFQAPAIDFLVVLPLLFVAGTGMLLMILDLFLNEDRSRQLAPILTLIGLAGGLITSALLWNSGRSAFALSDGYPMLVADNFAVALNVIFTLTGILTVLLSVNYLERTGHDRPEFYMLLLFSLTGMMLMGNVAPLSSNIGMYNNWARIFASAIELAIELIISPMARIEMEPTVTNSSSESQRSGHGMA